MEMNELLKKKIIKNALERRKNLNYIAFIKFLAMIKIIKWHIYKWKLKPIDYGARMCEILFISSGFLVGYNYYKRQMPSNYETSFKYVYKHLRNFYPLVFINALYGFFIFSNLKKPNLTEIEILVSNFLMINSWSRYSRLASCFDGISWFLSALIFCYFLVPLLLNGITNRKRSLRLFILISLIRVISEEMIYKDIINIFDANFHRGPIIRLLDFYLGMLLIPNFFLVNNFLAKYQSYFWFKIFFTFVQIFFPIFIYYLMLIYNNLLHRCFFVLIFCIFILVLSFDYGYLSDLFSYIFIVKIMSCQMEIYLLQNTINDIFCKIINKEKFEKFFNEETQFYIKLTIIFIPAYLYKIFLKEKLAKYLDIILFKIRRLILN